MATQKNDQWMDEMGLPTVTPERQAKLQAERNAESREAIATCRISINRCVEEYATISAPVDNQPAAMLGWINTLRECARLLRGVSGDKAHSALDWIDCAITAVMTGRGASPEAVRCYLLTALQLIN